MFRNPFHSSARRDSRLARLNVEYPRPFHKRLVPVLTTAGVVAVVVIAVGSSAQAAPPDGTVVLAVADSLDKVIENLRLWLVGILAVLATLFVTIGFVRYLAAGGDPGEQEKAKSCFKSAAIGYAGALLAPILVTLVGNLVA